MEELAALVREYGVLLALSIFTIVQVIIMLKRVAPDALKGWQQSKLKEQAHKHDLEVEQLKNEHLKELGYQEKILNLITDHQDFLEETVNNALQVQAMRDHINERLSDLLERAENTEKSLDSFGQELLTVINIIQKK